MVDRDPNSRLWGFSGQAFWLFGSQVLIVVCAAVYSIVTTRVLGPEFKGILTLAITIPGSLVFAFSLGLDVSCTYFISSGQKAASRVASVALLYALAAGVAIFAAMCLLAPWMHSRFFHGGIGILTLLVAFVAVPIGLSAVVLTGVLLGLQKIRELSMARMAGSILTATMVLALWATGRLTVFWSIAIALLATALTSLLAYRSLRASGVHIDVAPDAVLLSQEVRHGLKAHFGNLAQWLNYRLDILIIGLMLRPVEVGLYAAAVSLAELVWHLPNTLAQLLFPHVAKLSRDKANELTIAVCKWTAIATTAVLVAMGIFGLGLIRIVLGEEYAPAVTALRFLLPGVLALSISKILTGDLNGRGKPEYGAYSSFVALPITLLGNLMLIPKMGIAGAAITSSLSYMTGACTVAALFLRESRRSERQPFRQPENKMEGGDSPAHVANTHHVPICMEEAS